MSRNYGWGSRNAHDAVRMELTRQVPKRSMSFASAQTNTERFSRFHKFMKSKGVAKLEDVSKELVIEYGLSLAELVEDEFLQAAYAHNLISAINSVLKLARSSDWVSVSPTKDCKLPNRSAIRTKPTLTLEQCEDAVKYLRAKGLERATCIAELSYMFGLRSKEASLLNLKEALKESDLHFEGTFTLDRGTKGGRKRKVLIKFEEERDALKKAAEIQGKGRSLMPSSDSWKSWRENGLRHGRDTLHDLNIKGYHEFRAAYAARRYVELVSGWEAPCNGGVIFDKNEDLKARKIIAEELGHGRISVVSSYIGGRK